MWSINSFTTKIAFRESFWSTYTKIKKKHECFSSLSRKLSPHPTPTTSPAPGHAGSHAPCRYGARTAWCRAMALLKHGSRVEQGDEPLLQYCRVTRSTDLWPLVGPPVRVPLQYCGGTSSEQGTRVALRPSWLGAQGAAAFTTWWKQSMYCTYTNCCL